jgi:hypothetical protein
MHVRVDRDAIVSVPFAAIRAKAPGWKVEDLRVFHGAEDVATIPDVPDALRFLARTRGRPSTFEIRPDERGPVRLTGGKYVEDGHASVEEYAFDADVLFGEVPSWEASVYAGPIPTWFLSAILPGQSADVPIDVPAPGPGDAQTMIRVEVFPTHSGKVTLAARVGDADFGQVTAQRAPSSAGPKLVFDFQGKGLRAGKSIVHLTDLTAEMPPAPNDDVSGDRGVVFVDTVIVRGPTGAHAPPWPAIQWGEIGREPLPLIEVGATALSTVPAPAVDLAGVEEVIVATSALAPGARRLAEHRTKTGVRAVVVEARDVWELSGAGTASPHALAAFVAEAAKAGARFVLLCGDADRDRGDRAAFESIPTAYARTKYNGATASDRLLAVPEGKTSGGPAIGRLPFREAKDLDAYVDRVIRYETSPPADPTRRLLRFVTSEGRFGALIDSIIEGRFVSLVADEKNIPYDYDVEVTFASVKSAFCWPPPEFNDKVIGSMNEGALFYTYVGHGHAGGFDWLVGEGGKRFPILRSQDAPRVAVKGTPPALFVIACTTAIFDLPDRDGVGETLLKRPDGPVAYWGATRICHPIWNSLVGTQLASGLFSSPPRRLGEVVSQATDVAADGPVDAVTSMAAMAFGLAGELSRLRVEGSQMYEFLGDPALKIAYPASDLQVVAEAKAGEGIAVTVTGPFPDGAVVHASLETRRNVSLYPTPPPQNTTDASSLDVMRTNHRLANEKSVWRSEAKAAGGRVVFATKVVPEAKHGTTLFAKAWVVAGQDVHVGNAAVPVK